MSLTRTILKAQLLSAIRSGREDPRTRMAVIFSVGFYVGIGYWSASRLIDEVIRAQMLGSPALEIRLWQVCAVAWSGISVIVLPTIIQQGFASDRNNLLFTLPIPPATRLRTLYGLLWLDRSWGWLVTAVATMAAGVVRPLGWSAIPWALMLVLGAAVAVLLVLLLSIIIRVLAGRKRILLTGAGVVLALAFALALVIALLWQGGNDWTGPGSSSLVPPAPELVSLALILLLVLALGPLAGSIGNLYTAACSTVPGRRRQAKVGEGLIVRGIKKLLLRRRDLVGALALKELMSRSRQLITWLRLLILALAVAVFPWMQSLVMPYDIPDKLLVTGYITALALLVIVDGMVSPIGGEGNRLTLILTAPLDLAEFMRAKFLVFSVGFVAPGVLVALGLAWYLGLGGGEVAFAAGAVVLILSGISAVFAWGSAWDADLNLAFEGGLQSIIQEDAPVTARRMGLAGSGLLLLGTQLLVLWRIPAPLALSTLVLLNGIVLVTSWRLAKQELHRLVSVTR